MRFSWQRLTGQPPIVACFGTLQNPAVGPVHPDRCGLPAPRRSAADRFGGGSIAAALPFPAEDPLVLELGPQLELLARAYLAISHAGRDTALETLSHGYRWWGFRSPRTSRAWSGSG
jgi:zeaxanthin glucosyltransferase